MFERIIIWIAEKPRVNFVTEKKETGNILHLGWATGAQKPVCYYIIIIIIIDLKAI